MLLDRTSAATANLGAVEPHARSRARRSAESSESTVESTDSPASFAGQLASVIEKYLGQSENGSKIEIQFVNGTGQNSGARQFVVTVKDPGAAWTDPAPAAAAAAAPELSPTQMLMYSGTAQYVPRPAEEAPPAPTNEYDAYWAMQPPEVQVLRDLKTEAERTLKAQELAGQGFAIDVPIMVWKWDPLMTMRARESAGYTWVPSASNAPVELPPGIDFPGMQPYDPNNPPPGAIKVSTEWAKGLEQTSIWWRPGIFVDGEPGGDSGSASEG